MTIEFPQRTTPNGIKSPTQASIHCHGPLTKAYQVVHFHALESHACQYVGISESVHRFQIETEEEMYVTGKQDGGHRQPHRNDPLLAAEDLAVEREYDGYGPVACQQDQRPGSEMMGVVGEEHVDLTSVSGKSPYRHSGEVVDPAVHETSVEDEDIAESQCREEKTERRRLEQPTL